MKITLTFYPSELKRLKSASGGLRVVVIDVLRASSTITHAFSQGCKAVYPFASIRDCLIKARELGRDRVILGGERNGLKIKGFRLGNSPQEYSRDVVEDKFILITTTNCTKNVQTVIRLMTAKEILVCSFLNLPAVAEYLATRNDRLHIALSGEEGEASLEDVVCGGMLIHRLLEKTDLIEAVLSDPARLAYIAYLHYKDNLRQALLDSTHSQLLIKLGMEKDIDFCAQVGIHNFIPFYLKGTIRLKEPVKGLYYWVASRRR
ncbi:MAG TPA: 2-phosphosulfolactate phosphatase [Candidatus Hypogeohydataceae bacterium YC41]